MKTHTKLITISRACFALVGFILLAGTASAQTGTGTIQGRVLNPDNGTYLTNARVTVEGGNLQTFTDRSGQYILPEVPAGTAKVTVFYTGLAQQTLSVNVEAGHISVLDVNLQASGATTQKEGEVYKLDPFKVAASVEMNAAAIAINEQRFSSTIKNVVSTDAFGDITEGNLGDFVKFLPGVTIDYVSPDARTISVRGLPSNYTPVTIDGFRIASANSSAAGRTFELEQISINNAGRIEILKSRSPETPVDALGGAVNLVPLSAFDQSKPSFNYRAFLSVNGDEKSFDKTRGPTNEASRKIKPGFDFVYINPVSKNFGFTIAVLESNIFYPQHRTQPNWAPNEAVANGPDASPTNPYLQSYQVQDGPKNNQRESISATADWRLKNNDVLSFGAQWNYYNAFFGNRPVNYGVSTSAAPLSFSSDFVNGAIAKGSMSIGATSFRHKYGFTYATDTTYKHNGPVWKFDGGLAFSHATNHYHDQQDGHMNATVTLRGNPASTAASSPTVNFAGIAAGSYLVPTIIQVLNGVTGAPIDVSDPSNYNLTSAGFSPMDSADVFKTARMNASRSFNLSFPFSIRAGGQIQEETRDIKVDNVGNWNFVGPDHVAGTADDNYSLYNLVDAQYSNSQYLFGTPRVPIPDANAIYALFKAHPDYFSIASPAATITSPVSKSQFFREVISSIYLMGDARFFDNRLRLSGGARLERTQDAGFGPLVNPALGRDANGVLLTDLVARAKAQNFDRGDKREKTYTGNAYPSLDASFNVRSNIVARAGYAKSIGRPDMPNIIPSTSLPDIVGTSPPYTITTVNASLKPTMSNAYNVSLEYYFAKTGVFSVGAFRKDFTDFVGASVPIPVTSVQQLTDLGIADVATYAPFLGQLNVNTKMNVGAARVTGVEFNYSQVLNANFLPDWSHNFTVFANGQQMHLEGSTLADFSNFIPVSGSWGIKYGAQKFSAQVNWNYRGRQRNPQPSVTYQGAVHTDQGFYDYFKPRIYTDVNFAYRITPIIGLFVNARNLTNVAQDIQRYGPQSPSYSRTYRREEFGVQYTVGIKGSF